MLLSWVAMAAAQVTPKAKTGIEGVISVSPVQAGPVRQGTPDSKPLTNTAFVVRHGNEIVASFETDDLGGFRIFLPPGHYVISRKDWAGAIGHYGPFEVDVTAGQMKIVRWNCDSGLR